MDLKAAGTSAVLILASGCTTAGVVSTTAGVVGWSYPATAVNATVLESDVTGDGLKSVLVKVEPPEYDWVKTGSNEVNVVAGAAKLAPPSPMDPELSTITFKSPSFEWSGAPLFKQQLSQASAGYWKFA